MRDIISWYSSLPSTFFGRVSFSVYCRHLSKSTHFYLFFFYRIKITKIEMNCWIGLRSKTFLELTEGWIWSSAFPSLYRSYIRAAWPVKNRGSSLKFSFLKDRYIIANSDYPDNACFCPGAFCQFCCPPIG